MGNRVLGRALNHHNDKRNLQSFSLDTNSFPSIKSDLVFFRIHAPSWSIKGCGYEQLQCSCSVALQVIVKDVSARVQTLWLDVSVLTDPSLKARCPLEFNFQDPGSSKRETVTRILRWEPNGQGLYIQTTLSF